MAMNIYNNEWIRDRFKVSPSNSFPHCPCLQCRPKQSMVTPQQVQWASVYAIDPAKPGTDKTVIQAIPPNPSAAPPMRSELDRLWDLVVLAARASRYGE